MRQSTAALGDLSWGITTPKGFNSRRILLVSAGFLLVPGNAGDLIRSAVCVATSGCCDCQPKRSRETSITQDKTLRSTGPSTYGFPVSNEPNKIPEKNRMLCCNNSSTAERFAMTAWESDPLCNFLTPSFGKNFGFAWTR